MILGVDPGLHGALVLYDAAANTVVAASNIPILSLERNGRKKSAIDIPALLATVRSLAPNIKHVFLELVGAMPRQGTSSTFAFGRGDGIIETAIVAAGLAYTRVTPTMWKKHVGAPADKDGARHRASQLIPTAARLWTPQRGVINKEDASGIAEGALIAYYGAQKLSLTPR